MSMNEWAKREVELAKTQEKAAAEDENDSMIKYTCSLYDAALDIFHQIVEQGHSGMSIKYFQGILDALIDGRPLTPIEDTPDIWQRNTWREDESYQCTRMFSLFKTVHPDGSVTYSDVDRSYCKNQRDATYQCMLDRDLVDEMFPITMPYIPAERPYCFHVINVGDYDIVLSVTLPNGEKRDIMRAFKNRNEVPYTDAIRELYDSGLMPKEEK